MPDRSFPYLETRRISSNSVSHQWKIVERVRSSSDCDRSHVESLLERTKVCLNAGYFGKEVLDEKLKRLLPEGDRQNPLPLACRPSAIRRGIEAKLKGGTKENVGLVPVAGTLAGLDPYRAIANSIRNSYLDTLVGGRGGENLYRLTPDRWEEDGRFRAKLAPLQDEKLSRDGEGR